MVWEQRVRVQEFRRVLDGGCTVPGDGSRVTLGLGKPLRRVKYAPLAECPPPTRPPVEERAWVPEMNRVSILRKAMGDRRFFGGWGKRRWDIARVLKSRDEANKSERDKTLMPQSVQEARSRGARFAAEVRADLKARDAPEHTVGPPTPQRTFRAVAKKRLLDAPRPTKSSRGAGNAHAGTNTVAQEEGADLASKRQRCSNAAAQAGA